jgi:PAS domain S-box-containing protein
VRVVSPNGNSFPGPAVAVPRTNGLPGERHLRDLVALSTLPAVWHGAEPLRIAESLAASLFTTIEAEFVFVGFADGTGAPAISVAQTDRHHTDSGLAAQLALIIFQWAKAHDPDELLRIPNPCGPGTVHITTRQLGLHGALGVLAAAFCDETALTQMQHLFLNVGAAQATTAIQNSRLLNSLRENEERFRAIVSQTATGIAQTDVTGRFELVNNRFCELVGYTREELMRKRMQDITHPDDLPSNMPLFQRAITDGTPFVIEKRYMRKDGSFLWVQNSVSAVRDPSGKPRHVTAVSVDITERKRAEAERDALLLREREARDEAETLNEIARTLNAELDLEKIVQAATDAATKVTGAKFGAFFYNVINANGEAFLLYTLSGAPREAFEKFGLPRNTPVFHPTFHGSGVVRSEDITKDTRYGKMAPHHGMPKGHLPVRSYLAIPVMSRSGEVLGGLFFGHPEVGVFTERAERLSLGIAAQAAIAIDNARLLTQREQSERRFREMPGHALQQGGGRVLRPHAGARQ